MSVRDQSILITGASRGLGAALVASLSRRGARVVAVARGEAALRETVAAARSAGGDVHALAGDVADKREAYRIAGAAAAMVGAVDAVVHNASSLGPVPLRHLADSDCEDLAAVLQTNLVGPFRLTKALLGGMVLRNRGQVVFVSSDAAVNGYPGWGPYGVSKAAADHLARTWAAELEGTGVSVWSVDPGEMDTKMHADAIPEADPRTLRRPADVAEWIAARMDSGVASGERLVADPAGAA